LAQNPQNHSIDPNRYEKPFKIGLGQDFLLG